MKKTRAKRETTLRTETLSVRFDPKIRYLAKVAAQRQRRPISSFVEWAVEQSLALVQIRPNLGTVADYANFLWDVDEVDRFVRLAFTFEELLNHEEQLIWKVITNNRYFWDRETKRFPVVLDKPPAEGASRRMGDEGRSPSPNNDKIRRHWALIQDIAHGKASADTLPSAEDAPLPAESSPKKLRSASKEG